MDALYFPRLSLPHSSWTNPNLLFFDRIGVIAPSQRQRGLFDYRTRELIDREIVIPIDPSEHAVDHDTDEMVLAFLLGKGRSPNGGPLARIHAGKIGYSILAEELRRGGLLWHVPNYDERHHYNDDMWLEGPVWVVEHLMNVLALRILARNDMSLITDRKDSHSAVTGLGRGDARLSETRRRARAIRRLLPVAPDLDVETLLAFRQDHQTELRRFRQYVRELMMSSRDDQDFRDKVRDAELIRERLALRLQRLPSRIPPAEIILSLASFAAPIAERSYLSAAATGLGLGYLVLKHTKQRRDERREQVELSEHKLIFAALASRAFDHGWQGD
jgi:hypothetical protein